MAERHQHEAIAGGLLSWFDLNQRTLPWRSPAGQVPDPYHVWLSEIMLQQTTVAVVQRYFTAFCNRWPSFPALAAASLDEVLAAWAGLGYYARARNLHACARVVAERHDGRLPASESALAALPGIGPYTAAAIAAIAFDLPAAAVDGNVERVVARLHAIEMPLPAAKPLIRTVASALVPRRRPGDYTQALMDLGQTICTPKRPNCPACPIRTPCRAGLSGAPERLPMRSPRPAKPRRYGACFFAERSDGTVLLRRRPESGLLGGMLEFPSTAWGPAAPTQPLADAPLAGDWQQLSGQVQHSFTHFELGLTVLAAKVSVGEGDALADDSYRWVKIAALGEVALPSLMRKVAAHAMAVTDRRGRARRAALGAAGRSG